MIAGVDYHFIDRESPFRPSVGQVASLLGQRANGLFLGENRKVLVRWPVGHTKTPLGTNTPKAGASAGPLETARSNGSMLLSPLNIGISIDPYYPVDRWNEYEGGCTFRFDS